MSEKWTLCISIRKSILGSGRLRRVAFRELVSRWSLAREAVSDEMRQADGWAPVLSGAIVAITWPDIDADGRKTVTNYLGGVRGLRLSWRREQVEADKK